MKKSTQKLYLITLLLGVCFLSTLLSPLSASAQGTAFTYQGYLTDQGGPAKGAYDLEFRVFDAASGGAQQGSLVTINDLGITNGLFSVTIDPGANVFSGPARWLNIAVRPGVSAGAFTNVVPRQPITVAPYAIAAGSVTGIVPSGSLAGTYSGAVTFNNAGNSFAGNGAGLTGLNASQLTSGTVPDARLSANVALRGGANTFAGNQTVASGNVGIGTGAPLSKLDVVGRTIIRDATGVNGITIDPTAGAAQQIYSDYYGSDHTDYPLILGTYANRANQLYLAPSLGYVGIGTTSPQAKLDVSGTTRTEVLTITGGADVAEPFQMSTEEIPKGAVVVIDDEQPGKLKMSNRAYDGRVAGVISGANGINPGITLTQQGLGDGGQNVALSGRVYVLATASNGAIKPGDFLTSSDFPGHCMKASDHTRAQGAIIGKAMTSLKEAKGMVLVLVTLQ